MARRTQDGPHPWPLDMWPLYYSPSKVKSAPSKQDEGQGDVESLSPWSGC